MASSRIIWICLIVAIGLLKPAFSGPVPWEFDENDEYNEINSEETDVGEQKDYDSEKEDPTYNPKDDYDQLEYDLEYDSENYDDHSSEEKDDSNADSNEDNSSEDESKDDNSSEDDSNDNSSVEDDNSFEDDSKDDSSFEDDI